MSEGDPVEGSDACGEGGHVDDNPRFHDVVGRDGGVGRIPLCGRKGAGLHTVIDAADVASVGRYRWTLWQSPRDSCIRYARTNIRGDDGRFRSVSLHRFLAQPSANQVVDHWDNDGLNNTRRNLRVTDRRHNAWNRRPRSGRRFKGITASRRGTWIAQIEVDGRRVKLGDFETAKEAADAYAEAAKERYGTFAFSERPAAAHLNSEAPAIPHSTTLPR